MNPVPNRLCTKSVMKYSTTIFVIAIALIGALSACNAQEAINSAELPPEVVTSAEQGAGGGGSYNTDADNSTVTEDGSSSGGAAALGGANALGGAERSAPAPAPPAIAPSAFISGGGNSTGPGISFGFDV
jgi:hypothetical protein